MSEQGVLKIRVYTSAAQIPVQGATVVVTAPGRREKRRLVSVQITDESGMTKPVYLETPAAEDSLLPGAGEQRRQPFALCDVWAEHPGFAVLKAEDVQVFAGVDTLQEMELIPLGEGGSSLGEGETRSSSAQEL